MDVVENIYGITAFKVQLYLTVSVFLQDMAHAYIMYEQ